MYVYIYIYTHTFRSQLRASGSQAISGGVDWLDVWVPLDEMNQASGLEVGSGVNRGQREQRGVLGDIQNKGVVRCSLDSCLSNPGNLPPSTTLLRR